MLGLTRKSRLTELEDRLSVVAADRDQLYELIDSEQEKTIDLIKQREEARDIARELDGHVSTTTSRLSAINFLSHFDTSYFIVAVNGESVYAAAEIKQPIDGLDIAEGIEELLDRSAQQIADAYGIDLDAIREELRAEEAVA